MKQRLPFTARLTLALALMLLLFGSLVAMIGRHAAAEQEQESLQRLSHGLARHIVLHWPVITQANPDLAEQAERAALLSMLMVVNPGVQAYVLDAQGRVSAYIGPAGMVQQQQVDLRPVRAFLAGAALPLRGTDPMGSAEPRIFSAAMFAPRSGDSRPPGYLYVVLDGRARAQVAAALGSQRLWQGAALAIAVGLLATLGIGALAMRQITLPLRRLAGRMRDYGQVPSLGAAPAPGMAPRRGGTGDEVGAIAQALDEMTLRIEGQELRERQQAEAHREMMASVAHDLRTPLTALHGHLEALTSTELQPDRRERNLAAALAQSDKVRRLSQQLFELATLQSSHQVLHRERFRLDELVTDSVQKFALGVGPSPVTLSGDPPGPLNLDGDLQLIERALTNLIDNAVRHAPGAAPVRISLRSDGVQAQILVEDSGPGLPPELIRRLEQGQSLRDPPLRRPGGGIGGLGLAIAQRVAVLHGGSLLPMPCAGGGTQLCLALPLAS